MERVDLERCSGEWGVRGWGQWKERDAARLIHTGNSCVGGGGSLLHQDEHHHQRVYVIMNGRRQAERLWKLEGRTCFAR